jgi:4-hydroxy-tetrahydrodipicolinate synthase
LTGFTFSEVLVKVYERFAPGRTEDAFALFDACPPLIRCEQQPGIGLSIRKEILHRRGVLASPWCARPAPASTTTIAPNSRACARP